MPSYMKFFKEILANKRSLEDHKTIMLTEECNIIIQNKLPPKVEDEGSFTIPWNIGNYDFNKALCDLGASINLMSYYVFKNLGTDKVK